ncbi:MAG TPA: hypothetical protein VKB19_18560 [Pedobacter sp.]|nr:hypothetical protein [Pedobacter sp.]
MITLITSRIHDNRPDIALLQDFEQFCSKNSAWAVKKGAVLFSPRSISSRVYSACHTMMRPVLKRFKFNGAVISLGLPYRKTLLSKTFPYYALDCDLRVLWTYDVWEPDYASVELMVREAGINLLLLSSYQATVHFSKLNIPDCEVHWVAETVNSDDYRQKPWAQRSTDLLSFGRTWGKFHNAIHDSCIDSNINYRFQEQTAMIDTAVHGLKGALQFPTWSDFVTGLSDSKICICFPRSVTHPALAGNVSTLTLRYLQAMASKCLILGAAPLDVKYALDYDPVVEVNWDDPAGQIKHILAHPEAYQELIEKNYRTVVDLFHHKNSIDKIDLLVRNRLNSI